MFEYELVTPPANSDAVCTLAQAKQACSVLDDDWDDFIQLAINSAVAVLDGPHGMLGMAIADQEWTVRCGPAGVTRVLELPFGPVTEVTAIATHDGTTLTTQDLAEYRILYSKFRTTIEPVSGVWPSMADRADALQITFNAGAAEPAANITMAVCGLVAHWFENRGAVAVGTITSRMEFSLESQLANERRFW